MTSEDEGPGPKGISEMVQFRALVSSMTVTSCMWP